jgi:hypothetical protein
LESPLDLVSPGPLVIDTQLGVGRFDAPKQIVGQLRSIRF